jgi:large subunit ribosomal protein L22
MPQSTAKLRHLRIAPRKVRVVADLVRGQPVGKALNVLAFTTKAAARPLAKLLRSALANAEHAQKDLDVDTIVVASVTVDQGPTLRRYMPRAMGRATRINKKTSHVEIILDSEKPRARKGAAGRAKAPGPKT